MALLFQWCLQYIFVLFQSQVSGYVNYNIGMEPDVSGCWIDRWMDEKTKNIPHQVVWRVILPPGEEFWRVGSDAGVRLQHVTTGKFLTVTR